MSTKISVVVPVFNVERYLNRCIESILNQTFVDYEVILVDDGSTDNSGDICDSYANKYDTFKVIHKENNGLSHTRNVGVDNSKGEYIYFLDSDDYIIPDCLKILYENLVNANADISCGNFGFFDDANPKKEKKEIHQEVFSCNGREAFFALLYGKKFYTSSCNMLIKAEIAKNNLFPLGKFHEDEMTTFRYLLVAEKVVRTNINTYYYYQREGSIMHSFGQRVLDEIAAGDNYVDECKKRGLSIKFQKAALCRKYYLYMIAIENYPELKDYKPETYLKVSKYLNNNAISILLDRHVPFSLKKEVVKYALRRGV